MLSLDSQRHSSTLSAHWSNHSSQFWWLIFQFHVLILGHFEAVLVFCSKPLNSFHNDKYKTIATYQTTHTKDDQYGQRKADTRAGSISVWFSVVVLLVSTLLFLKPIKMREFQFSRDTEQQLHHYFNLYIYVSSRMIGVESTSHQSYTPQLPWKRPPSLFLSLSLSLTNTHTQSIL